MSATESVRTVGGSANVGWSSRYLVVDGIRTHFLEAGEGEDLVLLHSGEFGASAELSWEHNLEAFAQRYHVIAPDWLGFGETDKVKDFVDGHGRMIRHLARFLEAVGVGEAHFVGNSMGATFALRDAASTMPRLRARSLIIASGGGVSPDNEARRQLIDYDCTLPAMKRLVAAVFHDGGWAADEDYVRRRHRASLAPGAWECAAAARFRSPVAERREDFGVADPTGYERIRPPTLMVAGADDKLKNPGYAEEIASRLPQGRAVVLPRCGHCPNIETSAAFNELALDFLAGL